MLRESFKGFCLRHGGEFREKEGSLLCEHLKLSEIKGSEVRDLIKEAGDYVRGKDTTIALKLHGRRYYDYIRITVSSKEILADALERMLGREPINKEPTAVHEVVVNRQISSKMNPSLLPLIVQKLGGNVKEMRDLGMKGECRSFTFHEPHFSVYCDFQREIDVGPLEDIADATGRLIDKLNYLMENPEEGVEKRGERTYVMI
ncbi:hypothetical protein [Candidatus Methanodesulfokora washburnensis]|uniref:Uncharacterized protein n=1 Tax=Candidatus Methanodesulfokora washburnensis TaxID=2478471 RepID=A0A429GER9_9CREN|nr:hypothetical protein [Candidatus Methanodesulfokores washburnensis]RSN72271.1 hypothetical protein D6D85_14460 [Candidatus Methanodesulfokores washburnensis]